MTHEKKPTYSNTNGYYSPIGIALNLTDMRRGIHNQFCELLVELNAYEEYAFNVWEQKDMRVGPFLLETEPERYIKDIHSPRGTGGYWAEVNKEWIDLLKEIRQLNNYH